jgi:TPR repeat protein
VESGAADPAALFWLSREIVRKTDHASPQDVTRVRELTRAAAEKGLGIAVVHDAWDRASNLSTPAPEARAILRGRIEEALARGEPDAARMLGQAYRDSGGEACVLGVTPSLPKAEEFFARAVALGSNRAHAELASVQIEQKRPADALASVKRGAEGGDAEAMIALGRWLRDGNAGVRDPATGETWLRKAAALDHPGAELELAKTILDDPNRWRDNGEPVKLLQQAAPRLDDAQALLAYVYLYGLSGTEPDPQRAEPLLRELAERCHPQASFWLGEALLYGSWTRQDIPAAERYLKQAADAGYKEAWALLRLHRQLQQKHPSTAPEERERKGGRAE